MRARRALVTTLAVDAANVTLLGTLALAASGAATEHPDGRDVAFAYATIGLAGWVIALVAVGPLVALHTAAARGARTRGVRLIACGLILNTAGCLVMLGAAPNTQPTVGLFLLIGGDVISVTYLAGFAAMKDE